MYSYVEIWEKSQMASVSSDYYEHIDMFFIVVRQNLPVPSTMFVIGLV